MATISIMGGIAIDKTWKHYSYEQLVVQNSQMMKAIMNIEDYFYKTAINNGKKAIIFSDRGVLDPRGYMNDKMWRTILDENNWNEVYLRDYRYDMVIHLVTAAKGAEEYYTTENNEARKENKEQAVELDTKVMQAWNGHQSHMIVDNRNRNFQKKIEKAANHIERFIGLPTTRLYHKEYLIDSYQLPLEIESAKFDIEVIFLNPGQEYDVEYLRKRTAADKSSSYSHTKKINKTSDQNEILKRSVISARQYYEIADARENTSLKELQIIRTHFLYENNGITTMRVGDDTFDKMPKFIKVVKDITEDQDYSQVNLAKK